MTGTCRPKTRKPEAHYVTKQQGRPPRRKVRRRLRAAGAYLERPIEGDWPYIWIDATYLKVRRGGRIVSVAVIIAVGVTDARREVLGIEIGASEAEPIWTEFLRKLARRGLRGVKLVVSDGEYHWAG